MGICEWIYGLLHTPEETCVKFGHQSGDWRETSGRGRYSTCLRCNAPLHEHEWS